MSDRDIPSVPVTTLAGLNSLSDLLSELPVSDTLNNVSQINKSLLFHTLVANESNNLLSVRDDNLVRQLVNALEQTNSDNIELKAQYSIQQHGANISSYPELLQGIYNFRPTVFNTPQRTQNHEIHQHQPQQQQQHHLSQNNQLQCTTTATASAMQNEVGMTGQQLPVSSGLLQHQQQHLQLQSMDLQQQQQHNQHVPPLQSNDVAAEVVSARTRTRQNKLQPQQEQQLSPQAQQQVYMQQQQQQLQQQPQKQQTNLHFTNETHILMGNSPQHALQQQQQQQQQQLPMMNCQPTSVISHHEQLLPASLVKDVENVQMQQQQPTQLAHHVQMSYTQTTQMVQEQQPQQQQFNTLYQNQHQIAQDFQHQQQQQQHQLLYQTEQQLLQHQQEQVFNKSPHKYNQQLQQQQQQPIQQFNATQQDENSIQQFQQIQQNVYLQQQQRQQQQPLTQQYEMSQQEQKMSSLTSPVATPSSMTATTSIQGNFQNVLNAQRQHLLDMAAQQQQQQQQHQQQPQQQISSTCSSSSSSQSLLNHNKEFLHNNQLQAQHSINQLPAQAAAISTEATNNLQQQQQQQQQYNMMAYTEMSAALQPATKMLQFNDSTTTTTTQTSAMTVNMQPQQQQPTIIGSGGFTDANHSAKLRVCINRVKAKDVQLLQKSIKKFVQKSPDMAKKIGLIHYDAATSSSTTTLTTTATTTPPNNTSSTDTFTMMKADEKRSSATKRKINMSIMEDLLPEQIYSKPKVRRVERINSTLVAKCSKEEVIRSQTYQQFMRNMEQIIEMLDDTETPNFDADGVDDNIECISSKMLNTMSNDVAKLKAKQVLDSIPKNKLTLLINYAMRNVYLAKNFAAGPDIEDDIMDDDTMEKILNAVEACLLVCNIYSTAKDLKFLQEDNISMIIKFVQFQLHETIFPSYDPVYTVKSMKRTDSRKKSKAAQNHHSRNLQLLYSKSVELMKVFVTLFDKCIFIDTIVLPLSTLAVEPFFVDNIETLQFVCLELVTTIFRKEQYSKIRSSILSDILSSIDRLPSSKRNLRPFKLTNNGGNIQMVTALVLQLIQCATILPDTLSDNNKSRNKILSHQVIDEHDGTAGCTSRMPKTNHDVMVLNKYDVAISIGGNFLTTFLNKCKTRSNDTDFRPLFENFIHDLLATVNKPEWPASELLLSLLGTMLVRYVSNKTIEPSIRLVSLDYLGIVAARLRKDTVESRCKVHIIDSMIKSIKAEQEKEGDLPTVNCSLKLDPEEERTEFLQKILLDFLSVNAHEENLIWDYARHFYLAQWYRDIISQRRRITEGEKGYASRKKNSTRKKRRKGGLSSESSSDGNSSADSGDEESSTIKNNGNRSNNSTTIIDQELNLEIFNVLEDRKKYLLNSIRPPASQQQIKTYIDYTNAHLIAQYLATKRPFSQSFDGYLKKIILVVNEPSIGIRTRAMKCLANIVEVDPMVLKRKDMQMGVNQKFLDAAISVREAAVDLVGKFVLSNEELIDQYYDMLSTRILDTGVSVRKRVIKILRDICIDYPDFAKIPEICVKMIRRVNDEEGIQKLVTEVFMKMWFSPCRKDDKHGIQRKINQIIDVVNTAHDTGTTWLEGLLTSIFQPKENMAKPDGSAQDPVKKNTEPPQEIVLACQQLADGLVDRLIELEDTVDNERMLGCVTTLHLLAKARPQLLVRHAITIEPYLNIKCHTATAPKFICAVADILEKVVPMVNYASESFLASLEEHLMLLVVSQNQAVVTSCVSCLGALVNKITKNYKLIRDCFQKFYLNLDRSKTQVQQQQHKIDRIYTPMFRRSLFTIGILMRYFDFNSKQVIGETNGLSPTICNEAFDCLIFFTQCANKEIRKQALIALGSFCVMNDDYLTRIELKQYYCDLLRSADVDSSIKIICMRNIWIYLTESEMYMHNKEKEWEKQSKNDDLKEMNDVSSGMASRIIQLYLQEILDCFLHADDTVRLWAVKVVQIVLRQGLVHPVRMVPYLICLSTDAKLESAHRADALLKDIDKTYAGFVNMKVQFGLQLCFELQEILQTSNHATPNKPLSIVRGYTKKGTDPMPSALNDFLYTLLRTTKPQRRALVQTVTKQFDDQKTPLRQMLYIADNLAYFPYVVQDEPLYLIHQIDLLISMAGTNLLSTFKECLKPTGTNDALADDDDEEDSEVLFRRLPDNTSEIQKCITSAQACMLLLILKEHLKEMYSLTDGKISRYSPSEQKIYEKAVTRKQVPDFNPKSTIEMIRKQQQEKMLSGSEESNKQLNDEEKMDLVHKYLDFKQLMLKLDPDDDSDEDATTRKVNNHNTSQATTAGSSTPNTSMMNSTGANMSSLDESFDGNMSNANANMIATPTTPRHYNHSGLNNSISQQKSTPPSAKDSAPRPMVGTTTATSSKRNAHNTMMGKSALASSTASSSNKFLIPQTSTPSRSKQQYQQTTITTSTRGKRRKRKLISSDDDSDEDIYNDDD